MRHARSFIAVASVAASLGIVEASHADGASPPPVPSVTAWTPPPKPKPADAPALPPAAMSVPSPPAATTSTITPPASPSNKPAVAWKPPPKPKPKLPAPNVSLSIDPRTYGALWMMEVRNTGVIPLTIVADARLLRLEIVPPAIVAQTSVAGTKKKDAVKTITCELPASMRASTRTLVLPPGARYLEAFDPRMLCLDAWNQAVDGSMVVAHLGWKGDLAPPYEVSPSKPEDQATVASAKEIAAPEVVIDRSKAKSAPSGPSALSAPPLVPVVVKAGAGSSAYNGTYASISIALANEDTTPHAIYARPQLVGARVRSPRGVISVCGTWATSVSPVPDFIVRLAPKGIWGASASVVDLCPPKTFDVPGLYEVTPFLQAPPLPKVAGSVSGTFAADRAQLLRIETGAEPYHDLPPLALTTSE